MTRSSSHAGQASTSPEPSSTRVLIFAAVVYLFPLVVVLLTSLKDLDDVRTGSILSLPIHWTLQPWREAWFNACVGLRCTGLSGFFGQLIRDGDSGRHRVHRHRGGQRLRTDAVALSRRGL